MREGSSTPQPDPSPVRVMAIDDHPVMATGLQTLIDSQPDLLFTGTATTVPQALADDLVGDVVLLDLRLGDGSQPAQNVAALHAKGARVVVYTEGRQVGACRRALAAGALTVVLKGDPVEVLVEAIRQAARGDTAPTPEFASVLAGDRVLAPALSDREREALRLYASNLPAKSVARRMNVTEGTVKEYFKRIRTKYERLDRAAPTKLDLYQRAVEDGLIDE